MRIIIFLFIFTMNFSAAFAKTIVAFGDSLTAGYGVEPNANWVVLLQDRIAKVAPEYTIINAGVSGDTSRDALNRVNEILSYKPELVILGFGSNDGLRGMPIMVLKNNLSKIIEILQSKKIKILLLGFKLPRNYGEQFNRVFDQVFVDLANKYQLEFIPFLLHKLVENGDLAPKYTLDDRLHPNSAAQSLVADTVWEKLQGIL